jgi:CheY-like chemotaxis protein
MSSSPGQRTGWRIIATDDNTSKLSAIVQTLRDAGHCVFAAYDGPSALELVVQLEDIDLLITNTRLGAVDAPELMRRVREKRPDLPILHVIHGSDSGGGIPPGVVNGAKLSRARGVNALFSGPSGSGKTMAAEILARDLGLGLYQVDLATVVSKYIGETEKNLDRILSAAEHSNAILFFDETDALFGKRSEVSDSHDRYANIEISYLLQRMEQYDGIAILPTNLRGNLDDAFVRRP